MSPILKLKSLPVLWIPFLSFSEALFSALSLLFLVFKSHTFNIFKSVPLKKYSPIDVPSSYLNLFFSLHSCVYHSLLNQLQSGFAFSTWWKFFHQASLSIVKFNEYFSRSSHSFFSNVLFSRLPWHWVPLIFFPLLCHYFPVSLEDPFPQSVSYILIFFYVLSSAFFIFHSLYIFSRQSNLFSQIELPNIGQLIASNLVSTPSAYTGTCWTSIWTPQTHHLSPRAFFSCFSEWCHHLPSCPSQQPRHYSEILSFPLSFFHPCIQSCSS